MAAQGALWTQTTRVPLLISVPGMSTAGKNCAASVSLVDIYPTLNELSGLDQRVPQVLAGHSLGPLLKDPQYVWPHVAVTSHDVGNVAVTDARYHYIRYADGAEELYDHQTDPRQYKNLASQAELKPVIQRSWLRNYPNPGSPRAARRTKVPVIPMTKSSNPQQKSIAYPIMKFIPPCCVLLAALVVNCPSLTAARRDRTFSFSSRTTSATIRWAVRGIRL